MARFFFHSEDGAAHVDPDGVECADSQAAQIQATRYLAELLRDEPQEVWRDGRLQLTVTDEQGEIVGALTLTRTEAPSTGGARRDADSPASDGPASDELASDGSAAGDAAS